MRAAYAAAGVLVAGAKRLCAFLNLRILGNSSFDELTNGRVLRLGGDGYRRGTAELVQK
jgi:hypothetical protein